MNANICSGQYMGNLSCLTSKIVFQVIGYSHPHDHASWAKAIIWVTSTRYKIGGSIVTPRFGGLPHAELEAPKGTRVTDGFDRGRRWVSSGAGMDRLVPEWLLKRIRTLKNYALWKKLQSALNLRSSQRTLNFFSTFVNIDHINALKKIENQILHGSLYFFLSKIFNDHYWF